MLWAVCQRASGRLPLRVTERLSPHPSYSAQTGARTRGRIPLGKRHAGAAAKIVGAITLIATSVLKGQTVYDRLDYAEDFDSGSAVGWFLPSGWDVYPSEDGFALRGDGQGHAHAEHSGGYWTDSRLRCRVRLEGDALQLSVRSGSIGRYFVGIDQHETVLHKQHWPDVFLNNLAHGPGMAYGPWHVVEITAAGNTVAVQIDGAPMLTYEDDDPIPGGDIAVESFFGVVWLDDIGVFIAGSDEAIRPTWARTGGPLGGLGYDVRMQPGDPDVMYVTDAFAGVHKSVDGGQTWLPMNEGITTRTGVSGDAIPIFCLTIDPNDPDTLWAGTQGQRGIFKSTNAAASWEQMDDGVVEDSGITFRGFSVAPGDSNTVYAAAEISSWVWAGEERPGREFDMVQGVVYKTGNGGESWTEVWRGDNLARYVWIDPRDTGVLYVSTGIFDREAANSNPVTGAPGGVGIVKSTDGGESWDPANQGLGNLYVGSLFMHPQDPDVLLAGAGNIQYSALAGVYRSTDGGDTWVRTLSVPSPITSVEFATLSPNIAYASGADGVYRSDNGGISWVAVGAGEWGPPGVRAGFPIDLQVDPRDDNRVFTNNYGGGNFLSTDGGATWIVASRGYTGAQVRDLAVDPVDGERVYAAARSGVFGSVNAGEDWSGLSHPPAYVLEWNAVAVDPIRSEHILASNNWIRAVFESNTAGQSWRQASGTLSPGLGIRAIAFAPSDPTTVYAGIGGYVSAGVFDPATNGRGVYVSHTNGFMWASANDATSTDAHVTAVAIAPTDPQVVYAATTNHGILKTTNGGDVWAERNAGLPGSRPQVLSVTVHPDNATIVYAGLDMAGLYRSVDSGLTWQFAGVGMNPQATVSDVSFDPEDSRTLYAADRFSGVYRSTDGGATWHRVTDGLDNRDVSALAISSDGRHLYAATDGCGVFRLDRPDGKIDLADAALLAACLTGPGPASLPTACTELRFKMIDMDEDDDVDLVDAALLQAVFTGD